MGKLTDIDWNFFADVARLEKKARSGGKTEIEAKGNAKGKTKTKTKATAESKAMAKAKAETEAKLRKSASDELMQMCVWEYARECQPLREAIQGLHDLVGDLLDLRTKAKCAPVTLEAIKTGKILAKPNHPGVPAGPGSKKYRAQPKAIQIRARPYRDFVEKRKRLLKVVEAIVGRFNWHFLCSPEFPGRPWVDPNSNCEIKRSETLFLDRTGVYPKPTEVMVRHGRGRRRGVRRELPMPARFSGNFADYFDNGDRAVLDQLQQFVLKLMTEQYEEFGVTGFRPLPISGQANFTCC